ncbi:MAG: type II toxin-antitoxin system RelB/DinJ family antitoxin [Anaerolineales bacterium]|nr:type II toxin-antitoxin system RelB/DinJ family antitoxin [Anaerolineales bacterium]
MSKTDTLTIQIDPELKQKIEQLLRDMGLTPAQAITLFYKQIESQHGLPFEIKAPNKETLQAIEDLENRRNVKVFNSVEDALKELDI